MEYIFCYRQWEMRYYKKLIKQGCDVNSRDSKGNPVLYHAIIHNQNAAFDLLRKYGVPKSSRDFELLINTALSLSLIHISEPTRH